MKLVQRLAFAGLALASAHSAHAQDWPVKPITYVVPYTAGASTDAAARIYAQRMQLGRPIVVENRGGAASLIGTTHVARQPADGYTILHATSFTLAINPALFKKLPYDSTKDFTPVALVSSVPFALVVNPELPIRSVAELISYAKSKPGTLTFGSSGPGSAAHLLMELIRGRTGIDARHVPYRGVTQGLSDVVAGHVSMIIADLGSTLALAQAGKVRMLGVTTAQRSDVAPEIVPLAELGLPGFDAHAWHMVVAPANTPQPIVDRLNAAFAGAAKDPELRKQLATRGLSTIASPPAAELTGFLSDETVRWGKVVAQAGLAGSE